MLPLIVKLFIKNRYNIPLNLLTTCFFFFLLPLYFNVHAASSEEIIVLMTREIPRSKQILSGFKSVCRRSVKIKKYDMQGKLSTGEKIIKKIKKRIDTNHSRAILTIGMPATKLAKERIKNVPIFFIMVNNPRDLGYTGNTVSGVCSNVPIQFLLDKLKAIDTSVKSIGIVYSPENTREIIKEAEEATKLMGLKLVEYKVFSKKNVIGALKEILEKTNALLLIRDNMVINKETVDYIISSSLENRIPTIAYSDYLVKLGFLFALTPDYFSLGKQMGNIICMNHTGKLITIPSTVIPEVLKFSLNLKTAKQIGLSIPPDILSTADDIYK